MAVNIIHNRHENAFYGILIGELCSNNFVLDDFLNSNLSLLIFNDLLKNKFNMDSLARIHVDFSLANPQWGDDLFKESCQRLREGAHWGKSATLNKGFTSDFCVRLLPLNIYHHIAGTPEDKRIAESIIFTHMTNYSNMSTAAAIAQSFATHYCLTHNLNNFSNEEFKNTILENIKYANNIIPPQYGVQVLHNYFFKENDEDLDENHICFSLPKAYNAFLDDKSFNSLLNFKNNNIINYALLGNLIGAIGGQFPQNLIDKLPKIEVP